MQTRGTPRPNAPTRGHMNAPAQNSAPVVALTTNIEGAAGVITFLRRNGDTNYERLYAAWEAEGLDVDLLPELPSDTVACRLAVYAQRSKGDGTAVLARPLKRTDNPDGWALVRETTGQTLQHAVIMHVLPNAIGRLTFETANGTKVLPDEHGNPVERRAWEIVESYNWHVDHLTSQSMSGFFVRLCAWLNALTLRDTGGVYFIGAQHVPTWDRMVSAIRAATAHTVGYIQAMRTDEAVATILDSLSAEANSAAAALFDEIAGGELGAKALETRGNQVDALRRKVAEYEQLLGVKAEALHARLTELDGTLAAATMVAAPDTNRGVLSL